MGQKKIAKWLKKGLEFFNITSSKKFGGQLWAKKLNELGPLNICHKLEIRPTIGQREEGQLWPKGYLIFFFFFFLISFWHLLMLLDQNKNNEKSSIFYTR
jgi:hypothetical protein